MVDVDSQELLREARFWSEVSDFCVHVAAVARIVEERTAPGKDLHRRASRVRTAAERLEAEAELRCERERALVDRLLATAGNSPAPCPPCLRGEL